MIPPSYYLPLPPAVADDPLAFAFSLSGLMIVTLIFAEWSHRMAWAMIERPERLTHPRTIWRLVIFLTGISGVIRNGPDVLAWGLWKGTSPATRFALSHWNRILDGVSAPPQVGAWLLLVAGSSVIDFQLGRQPLPVELYPGRRALARSVGIIGIAASLSFAIAFMG